MTQFCNPAKKPRVEAIANETFLPGTLAAIMESDEDKDEITREMNSSLLLSKEMRASGGLDATAEKAASSAVPNAVVAARKEWAVGEYCRATFTKDGTEYEGKLTSIQVDPDGNKYGVVVCLGFEKEQTRWLKDLKPSEGVAARSKQICDGKGDEAKAPEVNNTGEKIPEAKKVVDKPSEVDEHKLANADDLKANGIKEWKVGDR